MKPPGPEAPVVLVKWYDNAKWLLEPVFEPRFLEDSFACRKGKGTHAGMRRALHHARRYPFALKCDLKRYFPSIDHGILTGEIARVVADARVMDLVGKILASHQDGVRREYGDDLSGRPPDFHFTRFNPCLLFLKPALPPLIRRSPHALQHHAAQAG